jgi:hypothetical protein
MRREPQAGSSGSGVDTPGLQPGVFQQPAHGLDPQTSVYLTESAFWVTFTALACILPPMSW